MDGINQHEMARLTQPATSDDVESLDHTIQMPGPVQLTQLSQAQQTRPDLNLIFGLNGYISGTGIALMANEGASSFDITVGTGILLLSVFAAYKLHRNITGNFEHMEGCYRNMTKYLGITGIVATLSYYANLRKQGC